MSTSGCWKAWNPDQTRLALSFRVVMDNGSSKFFRLTLTSADKSVTMAEITDLRLLPKS